MKSFGKVVGVALACALGSALCPATALASTGPQAAQFGSAGFWSDGGTIFLGSGYLDGDVSYQGDYTVYTTKPGEALEAFPGVSYDRATNTLTLDGVNTRDYLLVHDMGDDFKIDVRGENALGQVYVNNVNESGYSGAVEFTGEGSLTLNAARFYDSALCVDCGENAKAVADAGVNMRLYGDRGQYRGVDHGTVCVNGTKVPDPSEAIQFRGLADRPQVEGTRSHGRYHFEVREALLEQGHAVAPAGVDELAGTFRVNSKTVRASALAGALAGGTETVVLGKKVKKVSAGAFKRLKNVKRLVVKSRALTKKSVRGSFRGSRVKRLAVKVPGEKLGAYKKAFSAKNLGVGKTLVGV